MDARFCEICNERLAGDACRICHQSALQRFLRHELTVLLALCGIALAAFIVTRAIAVSAEHQRLHDADEWFRRGEERLRSGQIRQAVTALRRAAAVDHDRKEYRLALARALAADGQLDAAQQTLAALRERAPEDPDVNLALARLEAQGHDPATAIRHYQSALYGAWDASDLDTREQVRVELIRFLLAHGLRDRALSELLILAADLTDSAARQAETAQLFLAAQEPQRALALFTRALRLQPRSLAAVTGAARAAVAIHDYVRAQTLLRSVRLDPSSEAGELRTVVDLVLANDPLQAGITNAERRRRAAAGIAWADLYVARCRGKSSSGDAEGILMDIGPLLESAASSPRRDAMALSESVVAVIDRIRTTLTDACTPVDAIDRAWLLIAARHSTSAA